MSELLAFRFLSKYCAFFCLLALSSGTLPTCSHARRVRKAAGLMRYKLIVTIIMHLLLTIAYFGEFGL